jgi:hypothetical protein
MKDLIKFILKRIEDTEKEITETTDLNIKIGKGAKLTVYKELIQYINSHYGNVQLPEEEQKELVYDFPYRDWYNIEQLEDVIGEENSTDLHFGEVDGKRIKYDLEITIKRVKRSEKQ